MSHSDIIQTWFSDNRGGGLVLPDGWYGRPHDAQHALTSITESGDILIIVLDGNLTLKFEGLEDINPERNIIRFGAFKKLNFSWRAFGGSNEKGSKIYTSGDVKIIGSDVR